MSRRRFNQEWRFRHMVHVERKGLFIDREPSDLHIWLGPLGVHCFRNPPGISFDYDPDWRDS